MPIYEFKCTACGARFEVSRRFSESSESATCPRDGAAGARLFSAPLVLAPNRSDDAASQIPLIDPGTGWSHQAHTPGSGGTQVHSHGDDSGSHSHGSGHGHSH